MYKVERQKALVDKAALSVLQIVAFKNMDFYDIAKCSKLSNVVAINEEPSYGFVTKIAGDGFEPPTSR